MEKIENAPQNKKSKTIWSIVRSHSKTSNKQQEEIRLVQEGKGEVRDPKKVAEIFNSFFVNVPLQYSSSGHSQTSSHTPIITAHQSSSQPPHRNHHSSLSHKNSLSPKNKTASYMQYLHHMRSTIPPPQRPFHLGTTNEIEIIKIVGNFQNKTSSGEDTVPMSFIKIIISQIAEPLAHIFNSSLKSGVFPEVFKSSIISPIYKKRTCCRREQLSPYLALKLSI